MTSNAQNNRSARAEIVVIDSRPLFGYGVAAAFDPAGVRALAVLPEAIDDIPDSVRVALVALVVPAISGVVGGLVRRECSVIVYGPADGSSLPAATRAGATGFVSDHSGAIGMRLAVDAVARGASAVFPDHLDHSNRLRADRLEFAALTPREREVR